MELLERIDLLKSDKIKQDFIACLIEMSDILVGLDTDKQFEIISKTLELSYRSIITQHQRNKVPSDIIKLSLKQGRYKPIDFIKKWRDGDIKVNGETIDWDANETELDCPYEFTSRCTMGRCDCKPKINR